MSTTDLLLYDGHCRLCSTSARKMKRWSGGELELVSFRERDPSEWGLTLAECEKAVHLVRAEDGVLEAGVFAVLATVRRRWFAPLLGWLRWPGICLVAQAVYALIGRMRFKLMGRTCESGTCALSHS